MSTYIKLYIKSYDKKLGSILWLHDCPAALTREEIKKRTRPIYGLVSCQWYRKLVGNKDDNLFKTCMSFYDFSI